MVEHRSRVEIDLAPRLRKILADELPRVYALARRGTDRVLRAHREHAAADVLPVICPYTFDQISGDRRP